MKTTRATILLICPIHQFILSKMKAIRTVRLVTIKWIRVSSMVSSWKRKTKKGSSNKYIWLQEKIRKPTYQWLSFTVFSHGICQRLSLLYIWFGLLCLTRFSMSMGFTTYQTNIMQLPFRCGLLWLCSRFYSFMWQFACFTLLIFKAMILFKISFQSLKTLTLRSKIIMWCLMTINKFKLKTRSKVIKRFKRCWPTWWKNKYRIADIRIKNSPAKKDLDSKETRRLGEEKIEFM